MVDLVDMKLVVEKKMHDAASFVFSMLIQLQASSGRMAESMLLSITVVRK
jgi:hypothetical protein